MGTERGSSRDRMTAAGDHPFRDGGAKLEIRPINLKDANRFVKQHHRHHKAAAGHKFSICACKGEEIVGVAICGRPVSRYMDDGTVIEINRLCTDGTKNACSVLYGACSRIAKEMGYRKIITYILESENGASLKASNFICEGGAGGEMWTGERKRDNGVPKEMKTRWARVLNENAKAAPEIERSPETGKNEQLSLFDMENGGDA